MGVPCRLVSDIKPNNHRTNNQSPTVQPVTGHRDPQPHRTDAQTPAVQTTCEASPALKMDLRPPPKRNHWIPQIKWGIVLRSLLRPKDNSSRYFANLHPFGFGHLGSSDERDSMRRDVSPAGRGFEGRGSPRSGRWSYSAVAIFGVPKNLMWPGCSHAIGTRAKQGR